MNPIEQEEDALARRQEFWANQGSPEVEAPKPVEVDMDIDLKEHFNVPFAPGDEADTGK